MPITCRRQPDINIPLGAMPQSKPAGWDTATNGFAPGLIYPSFGRMNIADVQVTALELYRLSPLTVDISTYGTASGWSNFDAVGYTGVYGTVALRGSPSTLFLRTGQFALPYGTSNIGAPLASYNEPLTGPPNGNWIDGRQMWVNAVMTQTPSSGSYNEIVGGWFYNAPVSNNVRLYLMTSTGPYWMTIRPFAINNVVVATTPATTGAGMWYLNFNQVSFVKTLYFWDGTPSTAGTFVDTVTFDDAAINTALNSFNVRQAQSYYGGYIIKLGSLQRFILVSQDFQKWSYLVFSAADSFAAAFVSSGTPTAGTLAIDANGIAYVAHNAVTRFLSSYALGLTIPPWTNNIQIPTVNLPCLPYCRPVFFSDKRTV